MLQRATNNRARNTRMMQFPPPSKGWVQSGNLVTASKDQAEVLDNFIPTTQGARLRGGCKSFADCGEAITRLFVYVGGNTTNLFGASASAIYDAGAVNSGAALGGTGSELIANGTFDSDLSGWTASSGWIWDGGQYATLILTSADATRRLTQSFTRDNQKVYSFDISVAVGSGLSVDFTDSLNVNPAITVDDGGTVLGAGSYTGTIPDGYDTIEFYSAESGTQQYGVDNVSIRVSGALATLEGLASGDWSATQISTSGGQFLVAVNGADHAVYWDGLEFNPVTGVAVNEVPFDAETGEFAVGETVTGGTSGASAEILAITKTTATAGKLKIGTITSGPFQDNEALTDGTTGAATASGASASASSITITNVATENLYQVWLFKERLFFVEGGTQSVWYLPVESIGGAASEINLGSVFRKGGALLFGATWSLDSGSGLDDVCLFVSTNGEVAVYEGTDPATVSTWSLVGVYDIGKPIDKHSFFKAGGDLAIITEDGIIPISEALRKDRAALTAVAITFPIEDAWKEAIAQGTGTRPITATLWQSRTLLMVSTSEEEGGLPVAFVANARTGAWCRVTGWDVQCSAVFNDQLYFADADGVIYSADDGGTDAGAQYTGIYVPKFFPNNSIISGHSVGITYRAPQEVEFDLDLHGDYQITGLTTPTAAVTASGGTWGTGVWGTFIWGSETDTETFTSWQFGTASGYSMAPSLTITSNQTSILPYEIISTRVRYETGAQM